MLTTEMTFKKTTMKTENLLKRLIDAANDKKTTENAPRSFYTHEPC